MKKIFFALPMFFLFQLTMGQNDSLDYFDSTILKTPLKTKGHWGLAAGGFAGSINGNSYFGSFLSPNYTHDLTNKFSLQAGLVFNSFNTSGFTNAEGNQKLPQTFNNSVFYTKGIYRVNQRVFLTGGAYTSLPSQSNKLNPAFNNELKGGMLGIGYNFNDRSSIYFEMQLNKGHSPFNTFGSPFSNHFSSNPYNW